MSIIVSIDNIVTSNDENQVVVEINMKAGKTCPPTNISKWRKGINCTNTFCKYRKNYDRLACILLLLKESGSCHVGIMLGRLGTLMI